jgi:uncharacterized protein (DUF433 family)
MVAELTKYLGVGIYSVPDAARLTRLSQAQVRHWINGYSYRSEGRTRRIAPVINRQHGKMDDQTALGFLDLIEMRVIAALLEKDFSLQFIRNVHAMAQEVLKSEHPFAVAPLRVEANAKEIFSKIDDESLVELREKQFAFDQIVSPCLEDLDFEDELARRWWPLKVDRTVVIDPARRSGQPIVTKEGIATKILFDAYLAESSVAIVADWYEVSSESVQGAITFEQKFAA